MFEKDINSLFQYIESCKKKKGKINPAFINYLITEEYGQLAR